MATSAATQHQVTWDAPAFDKALLVVGCHKCSSLPKTGDGYHRKEMHEVEERKGNLLHRSLCFCKATNTPIKKPV